MINAVVKVLVLTVLISFQAKAQQGFNKIKSTHSVAETTTKLTNILTEKGMNIFATVDHQQGAQKAGLELRPTTLVIFGNPKVGTKLMQCDQLMGVELPLKMIIWQDDAGVNWIGYWSPDKFNSNYQLDECQEVLGKVAKAMANFSLAASK